MNQTKLAYILTFPYYAFGIFHEEITKYTGVVYDWTRPLEAGVGLTMLLIVYEVLESKVKIQNERISSLENKIKEKGEK